MPVSTKRSKFWFVLAVALAIVLAMVVRYCLKHAQEIQVAT